MRAKEFITEAFDQPYPIKWEEGEDGGTADALATLGDGTYLSIMFTDDYYGDELGDWGIEFHRNNSQEVTGEGDAQKVFATVLEAIRQFVDSHNPNSVTFSASKEPEADMAQPGSNVNPESRAKLYNRLVQRYASSMGYRAQQEESNGKVTYVLRRGSQDMAEARGLAPTKPYDDLMANMGYFMSLNTVKIQQDAVDSDAQQELANMQQQFRKPILNGMSFFDVNRDIKMSKNPKVAPILLKYVYDMLGYIEPRIKKYIKPEQQGKYLDRLNQIKNDYRGAVQQVS